MLTTPLSRDSIIAAISRSSATRARPSPTLPRGTTAGADSISEWIPLPATKETQNFAQLKSIDLSLLDSDDPAVVARFPRVVELEAGRVRAIGLSEGSR